MNRENIEEILKKIGSENVPADVQKIAEETARKFSESLLQTKQPRHYVLWDYIMTSRITKLAAAAGGWSPDAKIGLLLGLVFIFIIALIINGLPSFHEDGNNNQLVRLHNNLPAIAAKEREIIILRESVVEHVPTGNQDIHHTTAAPEGSSVEDFIESLRLWAELLLNSMFPEKMSIEDLMNQTSMIGEKIDQLSISDEQKMQLGMTLGRGVVFFQQLDPNGADWHYVGGGVKLGDAEKAIFWYRPKDSQTYRVIYGDLSVKDVAPESLPK